MKKLTAVPYFLTPERTPLVDQLLDILKERDDYIRDLEEELRRTKKLPPKPTFEKASSRKTPPQKTGKRPGSSKEKKTESLVVHEVHVIRVKDVPKLAKFKGHRDFVVQDISISLMNRIYRCERWQLSRYEVNKRTLRSAGVAEKKIRVFFWLLPPLIDLVRKKDQSVFLATTSTY